MFTFCPLGESQWDPKQQQTTSTQLKKKKGFKITYFALYRFSFHLFNKLESCLHIITSLTSNSMSQLKMTLKPLEPIQSDLCTNQFCESVQENNNSLLLSKLS